MERNIGGESPSGII